MIDIAHAETEGIPGMVGVVIPMFNAAGTIERCMRSVIGTRYPKLEIVVVDDCSTDHSPAIVQGLCEEYPEVVRLVGNESNVGPAATRNHGARVSRGEYVFFLDSDTEMLPDAMTRFVARMQEADAVTGIYYFEALNQGAVPAYKAMLNYYFFSRNGVIPYEVFDAARGGIRRDLFHKLGGFNEHLKWGMDCENEEFGYRLTKDHRNLLDPSVAVRHYFPGFRKLATTYFLRVALWMEIFLARRKFESGGVTSSETGISSACLLGALATLPAGFLSTWYFLLPAACFAVYLYGYSGYFGFVLKKRPGFLFHALFFNIVFTCAIAAGAAWGALKVITGRSEAFSLGKTCG